MAILGCIGIFFLIGTVTASEVQPEALVATALTEDAFEVGYDLALVEQLHVQGIVPTPVLLEQAKTDLDRLREQLLFVRAMREREESELAMTTERMHLFEHAQSVEMGMPESLPVSATEYEHCLQRHAKLVVSLPAVQAHEKLLRTQEHDVAQQVAQLERDMALLDACMQLEIDTTQVTALLAAGARPNSFTDEGVSPLLLAIESGDLETAHVLREFGATYLKPLTPEQGHSLDQQLADACDDPDTESVEYLFALYWGARLPVDALPRALRSARTVELAAQRLLCLAFHKELAINAQIGAGQTALHYAINWYQQAQGTAHEETAREMLAVLLDLGADLHLANANGKTPFDHYAQPQTRELLHSLQVHAA